MSSKEIEVVVVTGSIEMDDNYFNIAKGRILND